MAFRPLHDRVLVRRLEGWESRMGRIQVPESARQGSWHGEVIAAGRGIRLASGERKRLHVKAGDRILFRRSAGAEVRLEGQRLLILREDEILGVIG
jgi:chaperonin GroES